MKNVRIWSRHFLVHIPCIHTGYGSLLCKSLNLVKKRRYGLEKSPCLEHFYAVNKRHLHCSFTVATFWQCSKILCYTTEIPLYKKWSFPLSFLFCKCDQIRSFLRIWSVHYFRITIFCAVHYFRIINAW